MDHFMDKYFGTGMSRTYTTYNTDFNPSTTNVTYKIKYNDFNSTNMYTTNYTIKDNMVTIVDEYIPFESNYIYDTIILKFDDSVNGLRDYIYANNLLEYISMNLIAMYEEGQEFEDSIYRNVLDLLYEKIDLNTFKNIFKYSDTDFNKLIQDIIDYFKYELEKENISCQI